jgi:hypothetical protein
VWRAVRSRWCSWWLVQLVEELQRNVERQNGRHLGDAFKIMTMTSLSARVSMTGTHVSRTAPRRAAPTRAVKTHAGYTPHVQPFARYSRRRAKIGSCNATASPFSHLEVESAATRLARCPIHHRLSEISRLGERVGCCTHVSMQNRGAAVHGGPPDTSYPLTRWTVPSFQVDQAEHDGGAQGGGQPCGD